MEIHHLEKSGFRRLNLVDCSTPDGDCNAGAGGDLWGHSYPLQKFFQQFTALSDENKEQENEEGVMSACFVGQMLAPPSIVLLIDNFIASYGDKESAKKNSTASDEYRTRGNRDFSNGLRCEAAYYYTMSIVYAPNVARGVDDEPEAGTALSLAYGNRSAAFFGLGKFEACLADIGHAFATGYPPAKYAKLYIRKVECLMALGRYREAKDVMSCMVKEKSMSNSPEWEDTRIQQITARLESRTEDGQASASDSHASSSPATNEMLSIIDYLSRTGRYEPSTKLPPLSAKLEPTTNAKANCLVAKKNIKPGDILLVESPFVSVLARKYEFHFCHHCARRLDMKSTGDSAQASYMAGWSVPCTHCTRVLYCSTDCRTESWRLYHQFECAILPVLYEMTTFGHLALRMLLVTGLDVASRVIDRNANANEEQEQVCMPDFVDPKNVEANYETVCRLALLQRDSPPPEFALFQLASAVMVRALMKQSAFLRTHEEAVLAGTILARHFAQVYVSSHKISSRISEAELATVAVQVGERTFTIGRGMYPYLASTWKHSCDPNTKHTYVNGTLALYRATRDIPVGTEVTISLGTTFIEQDWKERQTALQKQFGFKCDCAKCVLESRDGLDGKYFPIGCKNCGCTLTRTTSTSTIFNCSSPTCSTVMSLSTVTQLYAKAESHLSFLNRLFPPGRINASAMTLDRLAEAERHLAKLYNMSGMANYCKLSLLNYLVSCLLVANERVSAKNQVYYERYVDIALHNSGMSDVVYLLIINRIEYYKTIVGVALDAGYSTGNLDWYARPMQRALPLARLFALADAQDESTAPDVLVEESRYSWKVEQILVARLKAIALISEEID